MLSPMFTGSMFVNLYINVAVLGSGSGKFQKVYIHIRIKSVR